MLIQILNCVSGPTMVSGKCRKRRAESEDDDFVEEKENEGKYNFPFVCAILE